MRRRLRDRLGKRQRHRVPLVRGPQLANVAHVFLALQQQVAVGVVVVAGAAGVGLQRVTVWNVRPARLDPPIAASQDRKSVVSGKSGYVLVALGGRRINKTTKK